MQCGMPLLRSFDSLLAPAIIWNMKQDQAMMMKQGARSIFFNWLAFFDAENKARAMMMVGASDDGRTPYIYGSAPPARTPFRARPPSQLATISKGDAAHEKRGGAALKRSLLFCYKCLLLHTAHRAEQLLNAAALAAERKNAPSLLCPSVGLLLGLAVRKRIFTFHFQFLCKLE